MTTRIPWLMLILAAAAVAEAQDPATRADDLPSVSAARGNLKVWRAATAKVEPVKAVVQVGLSDRVGTETGDHATLATDGDILISLKGVKVDRERGLSIERTNGRLLFRLHEGKAVLESFRSDLYVETPHGRIEAKQAYFLIEVTDSATRVVAIDGPVTFTTSQGQAVVEPGQESLAEKGGKPSAPRPSIAEPKLREFEDSDSRHNLLQNPGFEIQMDKWKSPTSLTAGMVNPCSVDHGQRHSGRWALRVKIAPNTYGESEAYLLGQTAPLKSGRRYHFRAYVRIESAPGHVGGLKAAVTVRNDQMKMIATSRTEDREGSWHLMRGFFTANQPALHVTLSVLHDPKAYEGSIWADDFYLGEIPDTAPDRR